MPKKTPTEPFECPCFDRQVTAPAGVQLMIDAGSSAGTRIEVQNLSVGHLPPLHTTVRLSDSLLYLTHCAWRC